MKANCLWSSVTDIMLTCLRGLRRQAAVGITACLALAGTSIAPAANIVWVSDFFTEGAWGPHGTGVNDTNFIHILTNAGHNVVRYNPPNAATLPAADITALNTNDLIIAGRAIGSGAFQGLAAGQWATNITRPVIMMSSYLVRRDNLGWFSTTTVPDISATRLTVNNPANPKVAYIFQDVGLTNNVMTNAFDVPIDRNLSVINANPVAGGVLIGTATPGGQAVIAEFPAGTLVRTNDPLAAYRMLFCGGSREPSGAVQNAGKDNLTADGKAIFLRAVEIAVAGGNVPIPPPTPTNLTGVALSGQVQISWSAAPLAGGYYIRRSLTSGGPYDTIATNAAATSYADFAVANDTTYYYVVAAFNNAGTSANSTELALTPKDAPVNLIAVGGTNEVTVSWDALAGAASYTLKRSSNANGPFTTVASGITGTSHTDTTAAAGQIHYYVVVAQLTLGGDSGQSATVGATTAPAASTINVVLFAATVQRIGWSGAGIATGYTLESSLDGENFLPLATLPGGNPSYTNIGLPALTTYFYRVQGSNSSGLSPYSNIASNTTPAFGYNINIANGGNSSQNTNHAPVPPGYVVDEGEVFGDRTNGFFYGWTTVGGTNLTRESRRREAANSPDVRYDTLNQMMRNPNNNPAFSAIWEFELTNGFYEVHVVGGDAGFFDTTFQFNVEGVNSPAFVATTSARWYEFTTSVGVSDGRLTINSGPLALNNKLSFIDIYPAIPVLASFTAQPTGIVVEEQRPSSLGATAVGSPALAYQWYQDDMPVPGATNSTLSYAHTPLSANGNYYLVVTNYAGSVTSDVVALSVTPDTTPPFVVSIGSLDGRFVGVRFNEEIDVTLGNEPSNFVINGGGGVAATNAVLQPDGRSVKLVLDGTLTGAFTLDVYDMLDLAGQYQAVSGTNSVVLGFAASDIGGPAFAGTHVTFDNDFIEIVGGGADFWTASDQGHVAMKELFGDFDVRVRVNSLTRPDNVAKAAILARESLAANSRGLHVNVNPPPPGRNQFEMALRSTTGGNSATVGTGFTPAGIPNAWLRLTRAGTAFTGYRSSNGVDWVQLGTTNQVFGPTMQVGLGVTAHTNSPSLSATGVFSGLQITQPERSELAVTKVASTNLIRLSETVDYFVVVTNAGPDTANDVVVTDIMTGVGNVQAHAPSQGNIINETATSFTWTVGTIAPNSAATLAVMGTPNSVGFMTNRVTVVGTNSDPVLANNSAAAVVQVIQPPSPIFSAPGYTNGTFFSSFQTVNGASYEVQYRHELPPGPCIDLLPCPGPDPAPWTTLTNIPGNGSIQTFIDAAPGTNRFYRIIIR
jgi:uncharacterized repeat protein (TIGR01451 family)